MRALEPDRARHRARPICRPAQDDDAVGMACERGARVGDAVLLERHAVLGLGERQLPLVAFFAARLGLRRRAWEGDLGNLQVRRALVGDEGDSVEAVGSGVGEGERPGLAALRERLLILVTIEHCPLLAIGRARHLPRLGVAFGEVPATRQRIGRQCRRLGQPQFPDDGPAPVLQAPLGVRAAVHTVLDLLVRKVRLMSTGARDLCAPRADVNQQVAEVLVRTH